MRTSTLTTPWPTRFLLTAALLLYLSLVIAGGTHIARAQGINAGHEASGTLQSYVALRDALVALLQEIRAARLEANVAQAGSDAYAVQFQRKVIEYTNDERIKRNLKPLGADGALAAIAGAHAADMQARGFFSHTNKEGCDPGCRIDAAGYQWRSYAENLHWMSGYDLAPSEAAAQVVNDWMDSKRHRENMLNGKLSKIGVGVAVKGDTVYTTAEYALPR